MKRLERWIFAPGSPQALGLARIVFFAVVLAFRLPERPALWADVPTGFWRPIQLFTRHFDPRWLDAAWLGPANLMFLAALFLAALGLKTRAATIAAAALGLFFMGLPQNFGKVNHDDAVLALVLVVFAVSRCGSALSVDAVLARRRESPLAFSPEEGTWPLRLIRILWALVFFAAGFAKLTSSGLAWTDPENLRSMLLAHHFHHDPPTSIGIWLAASPWLCRMLAGSSMLLELAAPLALIGGRWSAVVVVGMLGMQIGIWLSLGVLFAPYAALYLMWLPFERIQSRTIGRDFRQPLA